MGARGNQGTSEDWHVDSRDHAMVECSTNDPAGIVKVDGMFYDAELVPKGAAKLHDIARLPDAVIKVV